LNWGEFSLFRGYVFVRFSLHARLSVVSRPGGIRLLGDCESDAASAEEIDRIRDGLASGCLLRPHPHVSVGIPVRVRSGVFEGVEGKTVFGAGCTAGQSFAVARA